MNTAGRLSLYAAGLVVAFAASYGVAAVVVPDSVVTDWNQRAGIDDRPTPAHTEEGPDEHR